MKNKTKLFLSSLLVVSSLSASETINDINLNKENFNVNVKLANETVDYESNILGEGKLGGLGLDLSLGFDKGVFNNWDFGIIITGTDTETINNSEEVSASFVIPHIGYNFVYTNLNTDTSLILGPEFRVLVMDYEESYIDDNSNIVKNTTTSIGFGLSFNLGFKQKINNSIDFTMSYSGGFMNTSNTYVDTTYTGSFRTGLTYKF